MIYIVNYVQIFMLVGKIDYNIEYGARYDNRFLRILSENFYIK